MRRIVCLLQLIIATWSYPLHNPFEYIYPLAYPQSAAYADVNYGYNYAPRLQTYSSYIPTYTNEYVQDYAATGYSAIPEEVQPTLNVMAELPYAVSKEFTVVPMFIVAKNTMNMVSQGHITSISQERPVMTVKMGDNSIQCTPAVRMVLEKPIIVVSLKSDILFPSEVQILHEGVRIPIKIGAVIAPVLPQTYVSQETPISVRVVYAVPTKPIKITITIEQEDDTYKVPQSSSQFGGVPSLEQRFPDVSNLPNNDKQHPSSGPPQKLPSQSVQETQPFPPPPNRLPGVHKDQIFNANVPPAAEQILQNQGGPGSSGAVFGALSNKPDYVNNADAVFVTDQEAVVVDRESELPPKNITVINFPQQEAEPHLEVDEEDEELVNRNPPQVLAPAGIVQSTQPESHVEQFHNDKESPYLEILREEAKKRKI